MKPGRVCLNCGRSIEHRAARAKFCERASCRQAYSRRQRAERPTPPALPAPAEHFDPLVYIEAIEGKLGERERGWKSKPPVSSGARATTSAKPTGVEKELADLWHRRRETLRGHGGEVEGGDPGAVVVGEGLTATRRHELAHLMTTDGLGDGLDHRPRRGKIDRGEAAKRAPKPFGLKGRAKAAAAHGHGRLQDREVRSICEAIMRTHTAYLRGTDPTDALRCGEYLGTLRANLNGSYQPLIETSFPFTVADAAELIELAGAGK